MTGIVSVCPICGRETSIMLGSPFDLPCSEHDATARPLCPERPPKLVKRKHAATHKNRHRNREVRVI